MAQHEGMLDDFGLLLDAIGFKRLSRDEPIAVSAEGMAHEGQIPASPALRLPDVNQLVNEQRLP